jgi:amino acid transporter
MAVISEPPGSSHAVAGSGAAGRRRGTLRKDCLSYADVLAQSISVIAPSTVPAALLGLIFARAGNATWLSFLLGAVGLTLVGNNINVFARRSASAGSLYSYVAEGLSPAAGFIAGWALLLAYVATGMSTLCGFAVVANVLLQNAFGWSLPVVLLFAIGAFTSFCVAFRDIQLSARLMLFFEILSMLLVLFIAVMTWVHGRFAFDTAQLRLAGATPGGALAGEVLAIFAFSGFESSTALGGEARDPLRAIPRSVVQSVAVSGVFFVVTSYAVALGFRQSGESLANCEAPLAVLAAAVRWPGLAGLIAVGILLSFLSCTLGSINATARILYAMAREGFVADALGQAHLKNRTPHIAVAFCACLTFVVPAAVAARGVSALDGQGYFGTICSFGFIVVYILVSVAAPVYLGSLGKWSRTAMACSLAAVASMLLPLVGMIGISGSTLFPPQDASGRVLVAIFVLYMALGVGLLLSQRARTAGETYRNIEGS